jgi:hypothetical protein
MRTMARRRVTAWIALLGVAWAALWPLVSVAHARAADESMPLCHMAGMMVAPEETPNAPAQPGDHHRGSGTHCPLCIMAFYGVFHRTPEPPPFTFSTGVVAIEPHCAAIPHGLEVRLPESRAPPAFAHG